MKSGPGLPGPGLPRLGGRPILGLLLAATLLSLVPLPADAQDFRRRRGIRQDGIPENLGTDVPYDGRLVFARIRFDPSTTWGGWAGGMPAWGHDYPRAERNFMRILHDVTGARTFAEGSRIVRLDDPELFRFPVAYLCEPGYWTMTEEEVAGLRAYFQKGGFVIFDDFDGGDWRNFEEQMDRVLPGVQFLPMELDHPIFHAYFDVERIDLPNPQGGYAGELYGVFEDNDPDERLLAIVNYNTDIGDYFEYSDRGWFPIDISNDAYKLGVNYWMYALTR